ncbi:MAG TPA: hypothetical protein VII72_12320 [Myxococcota bacterium]|jgi:hypothetical protein
MAAFRTQHRAVLASALGALLALGCVTPMTQEELAGKLAAAAASVPGQGRKPQVFPIFAETKTEAWVLLADARSDPESPQSRQLSAHLATAASRRQVLVVGGPYPDLCDQVVLNAFALRRDRPLRGLTLVFVAPAPPSASVTAAASAASARLVHRLLH